MPVQQIGDDGLIELEAYRESALSAAFATQVRRLGLSRPFAISRSTSA